MDMAECRQSQAALRYSSTVRQVSSLTRKLTRPCRCARVLTCGEQSASVLSARQLWVQYYSESTAFIRQISERHKDDGWRRGQGTGRGKSGKPSRTQARAENPWESRNSIYRGAKDFLRFCKGSPFSSPATPALADPPLALANIATFLC